MATHPSNGMIDPYQTDWRCPTQSNGSDTYNGMEEFDMHRFRIPGIFIALTLFAALASGVVPHATAQDSNTATHPLVGMWWWENESADPFDDSFAVFQADGTYVEETPFIGAGIGTWVSTGERSADLLIVFQDIEGGLDPNEPASFVAGTWTFHLSIEVDATGKSLVASGPIEIRTPDGALVEAMDWTGTAQRVTVDWEMPAQEAAPVGSATPS